MTHRPHRTDPEPRDLLSAAWRVLLIAGIAYLGWQTLNAGGRGDLTATVAAAAVLLALVGVLLASALLAHGRSIR